MRRTLLAALLVLASACDSAAPSTPALPAALVGAWTLESAGYQLYLTSSVAQAIPNRTGPGVGGVDLSGAATARFTFGLFSSQQDGAGPLNVSLTTYDPYTTGYSRDGYTLSMDTGLDGEFHSVSLYRYSLTGAVEQYGQSLAARPFTVDGPRVTVGPFEFSDAGQSFSVSGTLTLPTTALAPGVRTLARDLAAQTSGPTTSRVQYLFRADGTYRRDVETGGDRGSASGTWQAAGTELRLSAPGRAEAEVFSYAINLDSRLRLSQSSNVGCRGGRACLDARARELGLLPGSLTTHEEFDVQTFEYGGAGAARAAAPF